MRLSPRRITPRWHARLELGERHCSQNGNNFGVFSMRLMPSAAPPQAHRRRLWWDQGGDRLLGDQGPRPTGRGRHLQARRRLPSHPNPQTAGQTRNLSRTPEDDTEPTQSKDREPRAQTATLGDRPSPDRQAARQSRGQCPPGWPFRSSRSLPKLASSVRSAGIVIQITSTATTP